MTFPEFINGLTEAEQDAYAERCGTTGNYLRAHLKGASRVPRPDLMKKLAAESHGSVTRDQIFRHFGLLDDEESVA